jgi:dienelactone hydrolase
VPKINFGKIIAREFFKFIRKKFMTNFVADKEHIISIPVKNIKLEGKLFFPQDAVGIVLFVHGSGSSRLSPRNQSVANVLNQANIATLLFDLLTYDEERIDQFTGELRFNIEFLADRLTAVTTWVSQQTEISGLPLGYFGASTGAAAALLATASQENKIKAIVSRGGRPDLAEKLLSRVNSPTLLIVGGEDKLVIKLNELAMAKMSCIKQLEIVPGATHLFEEPGTLEVVAEIATNWFLKYLQ